MLHHPNKIKHPVGTFLQVIVLTGARNRRRLGQLGINRDTFDYIAGRQFTAKVFTPVDVIIGIDCKRYILSEDSVNVLN